MNLIRRMKDLIPPPIRRHLSSVHLSLDNIYTDLFIKKSKIFPRKVVFNSYQGGGYGDNPKYIADEFLRRGLGWDLVWLTIDPSISLPKGIRTVRYGSNKALREIASSKYYVDNVRSSIRPPKRKGQVYLQTWHGGLAFKAIEGAAIDRLSSQYIAAAMQDGHDCDGIIAACDLQIKEFQDFWLSEKTQILTTGLPRNDKLFDNETVANSAKAVRQTLGINEGHQIILYMPTFRNNQNTNGYALDFHGVISAFERRFGKSFTMVIRMHPNVKNLDWIVKYDENIINATHYPDAQELYMAADFLITDYSSTAFDFSLLHRPVFLCALDYEEYQSERGLTEVFELCPFPKAYSNNELVTHIEGFSAEKYRNCFAEFEKIWAPFDKGDAASQIVDWMLAQ